MALDWFICYLTKIYFLLKLVSPLPQQTPPQLGFLRLPFWVPCYSDLLTYPLGQIISKYNINLVSLVSISHHFRLISEVTPFRTFSDLEKVSHGFMTSSLDYCNVLYSGISKVNVHRLKFIQNTAAWILTCSSRSGPNSC